MNRCSPGSQPGVFNHSTTDTIREADPDVAKRSRRLGSLPQGPRSLGVGVGGSDFVQPNKGLVGSNRPKCATPRGPPVGSGGAGNRLRVLPMSFQRRLSPTTDPARRPGRVEPRSRRLRRRRGAPVGLARQARVGVDNARSLCAAVRTQPLSLQIAPGGNRTRILRLHSTAFRH